MYGFPNRLDDPTERADDRDHDCLTDWPDPLEPDADDPLLPEHIVPYRCAVCGERWLFDVESGEHEVDR